MIKGIDFPKVEDLVFRSRDFFYERECEYGDLSIAPWMFPKLRQVTFGVEVRKTNGISNLRETATIIRRYCNIRNLKRVILKKDGDVTVNDEFCLMLQWMNSYVGPTYTFVPIDVLSD